LLIEDSGDKLIKIIDPGKGIEIASLCRVGRGPGEFSPPIEMTYNTKDNTVDIYERSFQNISQIPIAQIFKGEHISVKKINFGQKTGSVIKCTDSLYVGVGMFTKRYALFNTDGELISVKYDYPKISGKRLNDDMMFIAYQNKLAVNSLGNKLVAATVYCDNIDFFDIQGMDIKKIKEYQFNNLDFVEDKSQGKRQVLHPSENNQMGYLHIYSQNNHIYCLYSGRTMKNNGGRYGALKGEYIFVFDWDGNSVVSYKLDRDILSFAVDADEKTIYAITHSPEPQIVKYSL
jgi:hypothetical protein